MAKKQKKTIALKVAAKDELLYDGPVDFVVIPALDGDIGVVPGHAPFLSPLREGRIDIRINDNLSHFQVLSGFVDVAQDQVHILVKH